jgi:hypothetical protein
MADETKVIEATAGPYAGQRLTVPAADADAAIKDGWAIDPFAAVDPDAEPPPAQTEEERMKTSEAAAKAARKLRGEDDAEKADKKPASKEKSLEADKPASSYETRSTMPKSK